MECFSKQIDNHFCEAIQKDKNINQIISKS